MKYDREALEAIVARRTEPESVGANAFLDLHIKITPELLLAMLGTYEHDGQSFEFVSVDIQSDGLAYPIVQRVTPA